MYIIDRLYGWYGKRVVRIVGGVILILGIVGFVAGRSSEDVGVTESTDTRATVETRVVSALESTSNFSVVGTVRSVSEARLEAEAGGRVTTVSVALGDQVRAGTVLATIENSREAAALLQAEGAYESALASSLQSGVSLDEARFNVRNAFRDSFTAVDGVVRNTVDLFFSNPGGAISGFNLGGSGQAPALVAERTRIEADLVAWGVAVKAGTITDEKDMIATSERITTDVSNLALTIASILADEDVAKNLTPAERASLSTSLTSARGTLDGTLSTIAQARQTLTQAEISAEAPIVSQSGAQLKTALGVLRAAQSNYQKTLIRTPISGVVNALYVTEGTSVSAGQEAVLVANNGSLEIVTALSDADRALVALEDRVVINDRETGIVTHIAPAIDPLTGKSEVHISVDDAKELANGSTVKITFSRTRITESDGPIVVPLTALKLLSSGPLAFMVSDTNTLISKPVKLGAVVGESVEVLEGLTREDVIVVDARGLGEGDEVVVTQ